MADSAPAGSLYLLDAHGLIFQMYYGVGAMSAPDGRPTNAVFGVTRSLMNLYDRGADYLIATLDHKEKTFRDAIDVNYKAHRQPPPDDLLVQEPPIQQIMEAMHIPFLVVPGYEADDIMATIAEQASARGLDVFLCTADKDCRQLVSDRVKILNLRKPEGELLDAAFIEKDWGVRPEQVVDFQSLVGDSVDNVPGVPGVGPKTAAKWLQQFGTLDNLIAHADEAAGGPKTRQALKDAIANGNLAKSKKLVTLDRNVPLAFEWDKWRRRDWDGQRLLELFHEFGFRCVRGPGPQDADDQRREQERRGIGDGGNQATPPPAPSPRGRGGRTGPSRLGGGIGEGSRVTVGDRQNQEVGEPEPVRPDQRNGRPLSKLRPRAVVPNDTWSYAGYETRRYARAASISSSPTYRSTSVSCSISKRSGLDPIGDAIVGSRFAGRRAGPITFPFADRKGTRSSIPTRPCAALKPIFEDPADRKGQPQHQVRPDRAGVERRRARRASPAIR